MKFIFNKTILCVTLFCYSFGLLTAQTNKKYSKEVEIKIQQVEQNFASWVEIENTPKWNLQERMNYYKIKGISIAVIRDYKIDWDF